MKKKLLTLAVALLAATGAWAQTTFIADNLKYTVTNATAKTVELTGYVTAPTGTLTIPATVTNGGTTYSVTAIGESAFRECRALTSVTIPDGVTSIGSHAFRACIALTAMNIPESVTSIRVYAFRGCEALTAVTIPDGVTEIQDFTFAYCYSLKSVTIGKGVTGIEHFAFGRSENITELTVAATVPPTMVTTAFTGVSQSIPVYVPMESLAAYKEAKGWKEFTNLKAISTTGVPAAVMPESIRIQGGLLHNPQQLHLTLYDMQGRQVYSGTAATLSQPAGVYVVRCNGASGKVVF